VNDNKKLGEIFVEKKLLCPMTVERIVAISKQQGKRFGTLLEDMGLITSQELAEALAMQFKCRTVFNFAKASFPPQLLNIMTAHTALQNLIFPLKMETGKLHLAMFDPTSTKIIANIAANNGVTIIPYISSRQEINAAICKHYLGINVSTPVKKTVLVVEDDNVLLTLLRNTLLPHYDVFTAVDGMEAYKEAVSRKPHVILTDKEMPKLDGFGLLSALQSVRETRVIPVILISGTASAEDESRAFQKGFFDFIPKPVKEVTLLTRVKRAFEFYEQYNSHFLR
jgi:CheY-like chemotaxis protein